MHPTNSRVVALARKLCVCPLLLLPALALVPGQGGRLEALGREGKWAEARALAQEFAAATPTDAEAHFWLGRSIIGLGDGAQAVPSLEQAVALEPTNSRYVRLLGDACGMAAQKAGLLAKPGWAKRCRVAFEKAVALDPQDVDARWALMQFYRQAPGFLGGGMEKARLQAEAIKPLDARRARAALFEICMGEKKFAEAFALYDDVGPDLVTDYQSLYQLGKVADTTGQDLDRGLAMLRRCLKISPAGDNRGYAPALWRIGNILARTGDAEGARASYEAAVKDNPKFPEAAEALAKLH